MHPSSWLWRPQQWLHLMAQHSYSITQSQDHPKLARIRPDCYTKHRALPTTTQLSTRLQNTEHTCRGVQWQLDLNDHNLHTFQVAANLLLSKSLLPSVYISVPARQQRTDRVYCGAHNNGGSIPSIYAAGDGAKASQCALSVQNPARPAAPARPTAPARPAAPAQAHDAPACCQQCCP
jgi:hypothetical protein